MLYQPEDLAGLEVALLGVLSVGLPPSRSAGSDTFRVDHVTAVAHALHTGADRGAHLEPDGIGATAEFRAALRVVVAGLTERGIVAEQAVGLPAAPGGYEAGLVIDTVNPDEHPVVLDRYLAQACMELLLSDPVVYPYLMERYARSGEVWRRLRESGYGV
jgi:hypothetical protein